MSETEEIAKAIQESARFGQGVVVGIERMAGFFEKVLRIPAHEIAGMITDKLRFVRWKRLMDMSEEVGRILSEKGVAVPRSVPPKLALPIFEEASLEEEPDIQRLWNQLLANALNPDFNSEIRYGFIDMIKAITGREARLLNSLYSDLEGQGVARPLDGLRQYAWDKEELMQKLSMSDDAYAVSANNLMRMQLIAPMIFRGGMSLMFGQRTESVTVYKGIDTVVMTALGVLFVEACMR